MCHFNYAWIACIGSNIMSDTGVLHICLFYIEYLRDGGFHSMANDLIMFCYCSGETLL